MSKQFLRKTGMPYARITAVFVFAVHSAIAFAISYSIPTPDPWYQVSIQIDSRNLPPGVSFKPVPNWSNGGFAGDFSNSSATPFYLVTSPNNPPNWIRDLPANVLPANMAVSGGWFRMVGQGVWSRGIGEGIPVGNFLRMSTRKSSDITFEMEAYLGDQKIIIGGRFVREWSGLRTDRLELSSPLPSPLRLSQSPRDPRIINDGSVPLYAPLRLSQSGNPKTMPNPAYTGTVFSKAVGWITEVPTGFMAIRKLVAGKSYFAVLKNPYKHKGIVKSSVDGWGETPKWDHTPMFTERNFEKYVPGFKFEQIFLDDRPDEVKVPDPVYFKLTTFHGSRKIAISGQILYSLNPEYDPKASKRPRLCISCTGDMCDDCIEYNRSVIQQ